MRKLIAILLLLAVITANAEENPYYNWEDFECYAEAGLSCEELAEQWEDEHGEAEDDNNRV